jgi:hypothetical protein
VELLISSIDDIKLILGVNFPSSTHYESTLFDQICDDFFRWFTSVIWDKKSRMSDTTSLDAQKWKRIGMKMGCGTREEK